MSNQATNKPRDAAIHRAETPAGVTELIENQRDLDPSIAKALREDFSDLYEDINASEDANPMSDNTTTTTEDAASGTGAQAEVDRLSEELAANHAKLTGRSAPEAAQPAGEAEPTIEPLGELSDAQLSNIERYLPTASPAKLRLLLRGMIGHYRVLRAAIPDAAPLDVWDEAIRLLDEQLVEIVYPGDFPRANELKMLRRRFVAARNVEKANK